MKKPCNLTEFSRLARSREAEGELSTIRQLIELSILLPFFGVGPGFYQMAGFWKKDMPWSDKKRHLSASAYRKIVEKLNPMPYRKISQNKLSETAVFRLFHVPSPEYLGYYNNLAGQDASGNELRSANNLESFLSHFRDQTKICFKPLEGWAGQGFEAVEIRKRENAISLFRFKTRRLMNPEEFKSEIIDKQHKGSSIIAAYLEQHPTLAAFNSSSVNTMRLWVVRTRDGKAKVKLGYLRIGRENSLVDNQSSGGIVAPIDLDSGKLGAAIDGRYHHNVFREHPDHGALIEGQTIPYFKDSLQIAEQALTAFPGLRFVGADVAVSNNGPQIIEMNVSPDREGAAFVGIPSTFLLNEL